MKLILHIAQREAWEAAQRAGSYRVASLAAEGFIHCSTAEQVLIPANEVFKGQADLLLLCIDAEKVAPAVVYEDCDASGMVFPHVYGPLNLDAVVRVVDFPRNPDGTFSLPDEIAAL